MPRGAGNIGKILAQRFVEHAGSQSAATASPLDIVIRSLASREATQALRHYVLKDFIDPIAPRLKPPESQRAVLILALLTGISILKNVLGVAALSDLRPSELETLVANAVKGIMEVELKTGPR